MIKKRNSSGIWPAFVDLFSALALMMMMIFMIQSQRLKSDKLLQIIHKDKTKELRSILEACAIDDKEITYSEDCKIKIELFEAKLHKTQTLKDDEKKLLQLIYKDENKELRSILEACAIDDKEMTYSEDCKIKIALFEAKIHKNKSSTK